MLVDWMRVVLPPPLVLAIYALGLVLCEILAHTLAAGLGLKQWDSAEMRALILALHQSRDGWLVIGLVVYGCYRVAGMHPFYRPDYAQWLSLTPWDGRLPLPLGPVHLVPQDGVVLLLAWSITLHDSQASFGMLAAALLIPYLLMLMQPFRVMGATTQAYAIAYGLALAVWLGPATFSGLLVLLALYGVALTGLPKSLRGFAWDVNPRLWEVVGPQLKNKTGKAAPPKPLAYPFTQLSPQPSFASISLGEALLVSWLAASWTVALTGHVLLTEDRDVFCTAVAGLGIVGASLGRTMVYFIEYRSPISLLGRIATRRWIIPGFDRALLPIGCALLVALADMMLSRFLPGSIIGPLTLGTGLTLLLCMPPRLQDWALTGNHRIVGNVTKRTEFIEI